jgi:ATP-dependent Clp protease protease subunit
MYLKVKEDGSKSNDFGKRFNKLMVIPTLSGDASSQNPPDLSSFLFKQRIVYLAMSMVPQVTELIMAELLYLQYENDSKPIHFYINSTGVPSGVRKQDKLGYESEALAIYDTMQYIKPKIHTMAIGSAWGEAALILCAGNLGNRCAVPTSSIMVRQPMQRITRMQSSDIDIYRQQIRAINSEIVKLLSKHTGHSRHKIARDIIRPKYFTPEESVEYGLIDRVMDANRDKVKNAIKLGLKPL